MYKYWRDSNPESSGQHIKPIQVHHVETPHLFISTPTLYGHVTEFLMEKIVETIHDSCKNPVKMAMYGKEVVVHGGLEWGLICILYLFA